MGTLCDPHLEYKYTGILQKNIIIADAKPIDSVIFTDCDECQITLLSKIKHMQFINCRNIKLCISAGIICGLNIDNSADIFVNDDNEYTFNIDVYRSNSIIFDTYGRYRISVEYTQNTVMNNVILSITDYVIWECA